ncbi:MAG: phosphoglycerate dehydrogenase [Limnochordaceae bacterium]|nr:phosphoglycerate dehydrogenase [Limnochordaceae bacterium]
MEFAVLISDELSEEGLSVLRRNPQVRVDARPGLPHDELVRIIGQYDGLIVRSATKVTEDVFAAGAGRLKIVGRAGVGVDNIDVAAATRRGVVVVNAPEGNTIAAAEMTMALMLAVARHVPQAHHSLAHEHRWDRHSFTGVQLQGKVLGIIGLGRIGAAVARRAQAFEMRVLAYDPFVSAERAAELGVEPASIEAICRQADFITVHTPLSRQTEHLIGKEQFAMMKPGVRLINCARGGIIDEQALAEAIQAGRVAGAGLDVWTKEPAVDNPLLQLPQVVGTPHLGASTREAQINVAVDVAEDFLRFVAGEPVRNPVNAPALRPEVAAVLEPYRQLAERLGRLYTTLVGRAYPRMEVVYKGSIVRYDLRPLTIALLNGMLQPMLHEEVNAVNAPILAEERGIRLAEVKEGAMGAAVMGAGVTGTAASRSPVGGGAAGGAAATGTPTTAATVAGVEGLPSGNGEVTATIALRAETPEGVRTVAGTVTADGKPRLIGIDGYRVDIISSGYLLLSYHIDQPGIIGRVGTILGNHGINIAFMQVGRKEIRGRAVMAMGVDDPIPPQVLEELGQVEGLERTVVTEW